MGVKMLKKLQLFIAIIFVATTVNAQYQIEVTGGATDVVNGTYTQVPDATIDGVPYYTKSGPTTIYLFRKYNIFWYLSTDLIGDNNSLLYYVQDNSSPSDPSGLTFNLHVLGDPASSPTAGPLTPLPVELTSFTAQVNENEVTLNWHTATEVNNYGFEIEKATVISSEQSETRNLAWEKVGFVEGHGNSNSPKNYSFKDNSVSGGTYSYRLKQIDLDGQFEYSDVVEVSVGGVKKYNLAQNYPNPFNPTTEISFSIPKKGNVILTVYNSLGKEVAELANKEMNAGSYNMKFDASKLTSGIYFYKIQSGNFFDVKKMVLLK